MTQTIEKAMGTTSKVLVGAAVGVGVGFGTCGLRSMMHGRGRLEDLVFWLGSVLFFGSLLVFVLGVVVLLVLGIARLFKG